ncbi:hypothetical protein B1H18_22565 [Streptomyces tsukubensis]|uniref:Uncharacterized protein n=2 Tax=Streptomyces tsukubensis TaxID=83656 RepID=A0A1V4A4J5_9ACTN|nr:hypothetical protein B1H18_22565 [Streptomyces tsukubensis]
MTERALRIEILGPAEVAGAADELADSIRRDVQIATKLKDLTMSTLPEATDRMTTETTPAMAGARDAMQEASRQMRELVAESGRPLHEHPRAPEVIEAVERAQQLGDAATVRANEDANRVSIFLDQASTIVLELKRNQDARAGIRRQFTTAARHTLASTVPDP